MKGWNLSMRLALQAYLRQGYSMTTILEEFHRIGGEYEKLSFNLISKEVKLGLTESQIKDRRYVKYDVARVYENLIGKDAADYLRKHEVVDDE